MQQETIEQLRARLAVLKRALESPGITADEAAEYFRQVQEIETQIAQLGEKPPAVPVPGRGRLFALIAFVLCIVALFVVKSFDESPSGPKTHKQQVDHIFRGPGGSCPALVQYVKQRMNDPESFQHVETRYVDKGDYMIVFMTYRGRNAFSGVVTQTVQAKAWLNGTVTEVQGQ